MAPEVPVEPWTWRASAMLYLPTGEAAFVQPTVAVDRRWHLEARYAYEARRTASAWVGYDLSAGDVVTVDVTPMLGGVAGDVLGVAPGVEATVAWRRLELYTEDEVVAAVDRASSFVYTWTTLTVSPVGWLHVGVVAQRTRAYEAPLDVQRGVFVGAGAGHVAVTAYAIDPDVHQRTFVLGLDVRGGGRERGATAAAAR